MVDGKYAQVFGGGPTTVVRAWYGCECLTKQRETAPPYKFAARASVALPGPNLARQDSEVGMDEDVVRRPERRVVRPHSRHTWSYID